MRNTDLAAFSAVIIVYLVLFLATSHYPFFWDTVQLASKHASWFYQNRFRDLLLPVDFDSGHFPVLGLYKNLTGHRYLLPVYILLALTGCYCLFEITEKHMIKTVFATLMIAGLLSGNFWVYPDKISQGWDASLAYLPYPPLRKEMINYMKENSIPFSETGSGFPNLAALDYIDLNGSKESFATKNLKTNKYIFWSNIFNDFSDDEIDRLRKEWIIIKENKCMNVKVVLYKNPELSHN